jgi:orotate phosphoribosyltransferase
MNGGLSSTKQKFIELAIKHDVLSFGEFTLKSGRNSPYFFNAGKFDSGHALAVLGECYADAIVNSALEFDVLFGPAYKGIPLAAVTAASLYQKYELDYPVCFNRKEIKDHGEGGTVIGAELADKKILVLDDVITAGTAVMEVVALLEQNSATLSGVLVGLDRQERAVDAEKSAMQQLTDIYRVPVFSIVSLEDIRCYLATKILDENLLKRVDLYREQYGIEV